jgi:uncharacterized protein with PQ loop repeat
MRLAPNRDKWANRFGIAAASIGSVTLVPQLLKIVRTRDVSDLSPITYALIVLVSMLWMGHHANLVGFHGKYHGFVAAGVTAIIASAIFVLILAWR